MPRQYVTEIAGKERLVGVIKCADPKPLLGKRPGSIKFHKGELVTSDIFIRAPHFHDRSDRTEKLYVLQANKPYVAPIEQKLWGEVRAQTGEGITFDLFNGKGYYLKGESLECYACKERYQVGIAYSGHYVGYALVSPLDQPTTDTIIRQVAMGRLLKGIEKSRNEENSPRVTVRPIVGRPTEKYLVVYGPAFARYSREERLSDELQRARKLVDKRIRGYAKSLSSRE